jgi:hypothetical protein
VLPVKRPALDRQKSPSDDIRLPDNIPWTSSMSECRVAEVFQTPKALFRFAMMLSPYFSGFCQKMEMTIKRNI